MKILRVHIRNLNSLRGDHWIDFTAPPLADHSLYAIVGPTGAGKTTILDAITLALYGQTERNKAEVDRKDGSGTILTYGEGDCTAELDYEVVVNGKTERFRSAWTRQRAHKKPDGNLTASKHSISRFDPDAPDESQWKILATKKREVAEKTQEIVGLDYERFVRSVMLTQGDFARFLKSDAGNKAEILVAEAVSHLGLYDNLRVLTAKAAAAQTENERLEQAFAEAATDRDRLAKSDQLQPLRSDLELDEKRKLSTARSLQEWRGKQAELSKSVVVIREALAGMEPEKIRRQLEGLEGSIPNDGTKLRLLEERIERRKVTDRLTNEISVAGKVTEELKTATAGVVTAEKTFAEAEANLTDRRLVLNNLRLSAGLAEHKLNLKPGEECPVCGATEHPGLIDFEPVTDSAIGRMNADVNKALDAVETMRQNLRTARQNEAALRGRKDSVDALVSELKARLGPEANAETESLETLQAQRAALAEQLAKDTAEQTRLRGLQTKLPRLTALETELGTVGAG